MTCDFVALATAGVQKLQPYQTGKPLDELEREYGITNAIKLASNENPLGMSPIVRQAIEGALPFLTRYPDGNGFHLKKALSVKLGVASDCLTLGNGSNDILELIARCFVSASDSVVFSAHAFAVYPLVTQAIGAEMVVVPMRGWEQDLAGMLAGIKGNTRLIFIANPNNPTGTWVTREELAGFLAGVPENVMVVLDEAYFEYLDDVNYPNGIAFLGQYPNVIVTRTFSKAYGLAALRVGYAVAHPVVTNLLNRGRQPFNVNSLALVAAEAALADADYLRQAVALNKAGMAQVTAGLRELNLEFIPSGGNFVAFDVARPAGDVYEALLRLGVIVRPIANYGMPTYLRVTIGLPEENARFLAALGEVLA